MDFKKLAADISSDDWYTKKHALWTLARHIQHHGAEDVVQLDIFGALSDGIFDPDDTIRARCIWLIGLLAPDFKGQMAEHNIGQLLKIAFGDNTKASITTSKSGELEWTTIGELAKRALAVLENRGAPENMDEN